MKNKLSMLALALALSLILIFGLGSALEVGEDVVKTISGGDPKTAVAWEDSAIGSETIMTDRVDEFEGFLFSKLQFIGSRSEGPAYFLQSWDYNETPIIKKSWPWEEDPTLQPFLGEKVTIMGRLTISGIEYQSISELYS